MRSRPPSSGARSFDLILVVGWALGLRLLFALLTSGTYDPDEFVLLALSRSDAQGAVPYHDFMFFHPPGMLVVLRALQPLIALWWPFARLFTLLADTVTAALIWRLGCQLYGRRGGLIAGLIYGANPLALVAGVRVDQDSLITMLGMAGLTLLVTARSQDREQSTAHVHQSSSWGWRVKARSYVTSDVKWSDVNGMGRAVLAGACLGCAVWIKYPALLFLPVSVLAAPRRAVVVTLSTVLCGGLLFAPFAPVMHELFQQTIVWQQGRSPTALYLRLEHLAIFWLLVNALALPGLFFTRPPRWLAAGFALGAALVLAPQVYYHYWVPIVPFGALLGAPLVARATLLLRRSLLAAGLALTIVWALTIDLGGPAFRHFTTAAHFSWIRPAVQLLDHAPPRTTYVLSDRFEYAYLAGHLPSSTYFWDMRGLVSARSLEQHLASVTFVIATTGHGPGFPDGFLAYLQEHRIPVRHLGGADVWVLRS